MNNNNNNNKIYWTGVEYNYSDNKSLKGGFVYAFINALDVRDALEKLLKGLEEEKLIPLDVEFISPYDQDMEWEEKGQTKRYIELYNDALNTEQVIFDDFYAYETE